MFKFWWAQYFRTCWWFFLQILWSSNQLGEWPRVLWCPCQAFLSLPLGRRWSFTMPESNLSSVNLSACNIVSNYFKQCHHHYYRNHYQTMIMVIWRITCRQAWYRGPLSLPSSVSSLSSSLSSQLKNNNCRRAWLRVQSYSAPDVPSHTSLLIRFDSYAFTSSS